jgi:DNA polymerase (family 10)
VLAGLDDMRYGIGTARKGWLRVEDVLNTFELDALLAYFRASRSTIS